MAGLSQTLGRIARGRAADPLAPVTIVVPSHLAGLQLRRRLGQMGPFAGVRFETLPRLAEIVAAGDLASQGRSPLARPIGDYLAAQVALESRAELAGVRELPGFGRVLRQLFRRIRQGGITSPERVRLPLSNGYMGELMRLYADFRTRTASFYDPEDLLDAAASLLRGRRGAFVAELGAVYVVPPGALSAGAEALLRALRAAAPKYTAVDEAQLVAAESFVLASDPAIEAREAVRSVLGRLSEGAGWHEVAVFHGAGRTYARLLREAFDAAGVPAASMPGTALAETGAGRAVLLLASLPAEDYSRTAVMDFLAIAPLRARIPGGEGGVHPLPAAWDRMSREAGVTKGARRWESGLEALAADSRARLREPELAENRRYAIQRQLDETGSLARVIEALIARLEPLRALEPARQFVERFGAVVAEYLAPDALALDKVRAEIEQLGTVGAVGGSFALGSFVQALRANLETAALRERGLGEGVLVAEYSRAAGLEFEHVVLCGAYEGSFPAGPGGDTLVDDSDWAHLRQVYPHIEDASLRVERANDAAKRAMAAGAGTLTWMAPLFEPGGAREYYPSHLMVQAAGRADASVRSASDLRRAASSETLRRSASPLAAGLRGLAVDRGEAALRQAVSRVQAGVRPGPGDRLMAPLTLLRARRGAAFSEYDGNVSALAASQGLWRSRSASPTSLEHYATCGFRYFAGSVLHLNTTDEPEDRDVMEPAERGSLVHDVLDAFFKERKAEGRPKAREVWSRADLARLLVIADAKIDDARLRGRTGLDVFADHDVRGIVSDLALFLEADNAFRLETGAVPEAFETYLPTAEIAGIEFRGVVDRIDLSPDRTKAWVIDYKTGSSQPFEAVAGGPDAPFAGGTKLQLPAYVAAAGGASEVEALYWFISRKGGFKRISYEPTAENQERFRDTVAAILDGIGQGAFPAVPGDEDEYYGGWKNCKYCEFERICSRRRELDFHLKAEDPSMAPWAQVAAIARRPGQ